MCRFVGVDVVLRGRTLSPVFFFFFHSPSRLETNVNTTDTLQDAQKHEMVTGGFKGRLWERGCERLNFFSHLRREESEALHVILCCNRTEEGKMFSFTFSCLHASDLDGTDVKFLLSTNNSKQVKSV